MKKKVLVFAPHPDDETWGCGGTIAKRISEGYDVLIVVMTDGRYAFLKILGIEKDPTPEELKEIRKEEVKKATRILGVPEENLIFLDFVDGTLQENIEEAERMVTSILQEHKPVEVYFPYKNDCHPDHQAAYKIVKKSLAKLGLQTREYQYSIMHKYARLGPIIDRALSFFKHNMIKVDISAFLSTKEKAVHEFKSELKTISKEQSNPLTKNVKKYLKKEELFLHSWKIEVLV
ncbi:MAG: PIG-L deacetylase family protein [Candidatus Bathycorpusculaceae bacterium]